MALEVWSDLHQDLITDSAGNIKKSINIDSVKTSIDNILRTAPSERVFLPTFALGLDDYVFEPLGSNILSRLASNIKSVIETWDDRVIVNEVSVKTFPDQHRLDIILSFGIKGYSENIFQTVAISL